MTHSPTGGQMRIPQKYRLIGQGVARRVPEVLARRGLEPRFAQWVMTRHGGHVWLFGVLDVGAVSRLERYTDDADLLHHLSTVCGGVPVYVSNSDGVRYAFLLSERPQIPPRAPFPGCLRGLVRVGVGPTNTPPVDVPWDDLGHLLVAGMTGSGKSNFLRLLVYQALREGASLLLGDLDGATFPMLASSQALLAPLGHMPDGVHRLVGRGLAECDRRKALYQGTAGYPETLEEYNRQAVRHAQTPLPRLLVVLDEFNATAVALGGARGDFAADVAALCWRGRKFGVNVVVAAQDFDKRIVGRMRDQVNAVCFRVQSPHLARAVGCTGAHTIPANRPGRAVTAQWGPVQAYYLDKELLIDGDRTPVLDQTETELVTWALRENEGYLALSDIEAQSDLGHRAARRLASDWERRGWLVKDVHAYNRRRVTEELASLLANRRTCQARQARQTAVPGDDRVV